MNILFRKFDIAVRSKQILFTFDYQTFRDSMSKRSINLPRHPPGPLGRYLTPAEVIPVSDNTGVEINTSRGVIATRGVYPRETLEIFNKIVECINGDLYLNLSKYAWFYEIVSECSVQIGKNPIEIFLKKFSKCYSPDKLEGIFGRKSQINRVRVGPSSVTPSRPDYYDVDLMPDIFRPKDSLLIQFVYREPQLKPIQKAANDMESIVSTIVSTLLD